MATHVCPWWIGYLLASPIRKLFHKPEDILRPHVRAGMTVADLGCAMGFFSMPMARMVGDRGKVICVDVQERMLKTLHKRASKAGVDARIESRPCQGETLGLEDKTGSVDFALAFAMVHEVTNQSQFLTEVHELLVPGGRLLIAEPTGHVSTESFEEMLTIARAEGFAAVKTPRISRCISVLFEKELQG